MEIKFSFADTLKAVGVPMVKLLVNGHEGYFIVDTGSNTCCIDECFAREIGAEEIHATSHNTISLGGRSPISHSYYITIGLGDMELSEVLCSGTNFGAAKEHIRKKGFCVDGIIGMPVMRALQADIDLKRSTLTFNLPDNINE